MMVPRAFLHTSIPPGRTSYLEEKELRAPRRQGLEQLRGLKESPAPHPTPSHRTSEPAQRAQAVPVSIPQRKNIRSVSRPTRSAQDIPSIITTPASVKGSDQIPKAGSGVQHIDSLLAATTIPRRKTKSRRPQRLPDCDHVADFSKLLLDDVKSTEDRSLAGSLSKPHF